MENGKTKLEIFLINFRKALIKYWGQLIAIAAIIFPLINFVQEIGFLEQWPNLGATFIAVIVLLGGLFGLKVPPGTFPELPPGDSIEDNTENKT